MIKKDKDIIYMGSCCCPLLPLLPSAAAVVTYCRSLLPPVYPVTTICLCCHQLSLLPPAASLALITSSDNTYLFCGNAILYVC